MLLVTGTAGTLSVVTSSAATIKVHASYVDAPSPILFNSSTAPDDLDTAIASSTTTIVVEGPGANLVRNVKLLTIINADASVDCTVTLLHTDGTTTAPIFPATLLVPGDGITVDDTGKITQLSTVVGITGPAGPIGPAGPMGPTGVGAPIVGSATIDFGIGDNIATVTVTGQTSILSGSTITAYLMGDTSADHTAYEHNMVPMKLCCGNIVPGTGFNIVGTCFNTIIGKWTVRWAWN